MAQYKLYLLGESGMIARAIYLECVDDEDAVHQATARVERGGAELWLGNRMLKAFDRQDPA